jgi:phage replication-related protein YjqB (UPF0714/DUF867 family)
MDKYGSFAELKLHERQDADYRVVRVDRPDSPVIILAPHGGEIEVGTSQIAALIAGDEHSLFCFEGLRIEAGSRDLHITSHRFDHPDCISLAARHRVVLAVHGCRGRAQVFVGGLDTELSRCLTHRLTLAGFDAVAGDHAYPGRHPQNICNRGSRGRGAQLEITHDLRAVEHREAIASAVRDAIADLGCDVA